MFDKDFIIEANAARKKEIVGMLLIDA